MLGAQPLLPTRRAALRRRGRPYLEAGDSGRLTAGNAGDATPALSPSQPAGALRREGRAAWDSGTLPGSLEARPSPAPPLTAWP